MHHFQFEDIVILGNHGVFVSVWNAVEANKEFEVRLKMCVLAKAII